MNRNEFAQTVKTMMNASSCCQELKCAGQKYLDSCGTADEKNAFDALIAEVKEDVCTLEHALAFLNLRWRSGFSEPNVPKH